MRTDSPRVLWELAGLGEAAAPLSTEPLATYPKAVILGDLLVWDWSPSLPAPLLERIGRDTTFEEVLTPAPATGTVTDQDLPRPQQRATAKLLSGFAGIHARSDEQIRRFASTWGPLGICEHGRLCGHVPEGCYPTRGAGCVAERLSDWRTWSRRATAVLSIVSAFPTGSPGDVTDWRALAESSADQNAARMITAPNSGIHADDSRIGDPLGSAHRQLAEYLDRWLAEGDVSFGVSWHAGHGGDSRPTVRFRSSTLIGMIGLQLVTTLARADGLTTCAGCGIPFLAPRRGGRGPNRYCSACGLPAAQRAASRRLYARKKAERDAARAETHEGGMA